jgi:hypothetical protein
LRHPGALGRDDHSRDEGVVGAAHAYERSFVAPRLTPVDERNHAPASGEVPNSFHGVALSAPGERHASRTPRQQRQSNRALWGTRTPDPFLTMTPRGMAGVLRISIYAANTVFRGSDAGDCDSFVRAAVSEKFPRASCPRDRHLPLASRSRETSSHRGDEFAQLPDQDRLELDFTFGCFPVGAFEHRLQACRLGPSGGQRNIVMLGLLHQSRVLVFTAVELLRLRVTQLRAVNHEENEQLLAIPT